MIRKQAKATQISPLLDLISSNTSTAIYLLHFNPRIIFCFFYCDDQNTLELTMLFPERLVPDRKGLQMSDNSYIHFFRTAN